MIKNYIREIFIRDLTQLKTEIRLYSDEKKIWMISENILNSGGNLCLHIIGNLKHFIGNILGKSGFVRDRESEFKLKNIPREQLLISIDETITIVSETIESLPEETLSKNYPVEYSKKIITTENLFLHLITHLNYHLGQVNYHRRLIDN